MPTRRTNAAVGAAATLAAATALVVATTPTNGQQDVPEKEKPCYVIASEDTSDEERTQVLESMPLYFQARWGSVEAGNMTREEFLSDCSTEVYAR